MANIFAKYILCVHARIDGVSRGASYKRATSCHLLLPQFGRRENLSSCAAHAATDSSEKTVSEENINITGVTKSAMDLPAINWGIGFDDMPTANCVMSMFCSFHDEVKS